MRESVQGRPSRLAIREQYGKGFNGAESSPPLGGGIVGSGVRVFSNVVLAAIPPAGIALPLWATFQWDMPVPLALTVITLVWGLSLALIVMAARDKTRSTKHVALGSGIVEAIQTSSTDSGNIRVDTGDRSDEFTAQASYAGQLRRGDSVVFAYIPTKWGRSPNTVYQESSGERVTDGRILRIATIDRD